MGCNCNKNNGYTPKNIIKGVIKLSKVALSMDKAPDDIISARRDVCRNCEYSTKNKDKINTPSKGLSLRSICTNCKCFIAAKTQLLNEQCPLGKWIK